MAALLALSAAVAYGAGDFLGGVASRRIPATAVVLWSHLVGLVVLVLAAPLVGGEPTGRAVAVGAVGGIVGAAGLTLFYQALSQGTMSVVAPITALLSAAVPVLVGFGSGERPDVMAVAGIGLALAAITLVSRDEGESAEGRHRNPSPAGWGPTADEAGLIPARLGVLGTPLLLALAAGLGFGLFFVIIDAAGDGTGVWSLVAARIASVSLFGALGATGLLAAAPPRRDVAAVAAGAGALDAAANAFYVLALGHGLLSVVSVLTTLYPAGTVLLARFVLGERMSRGQRTGLAVAGIAALLIAV